MIYNDDVQILRVDESFSTAWKIYETHVVDFFGDRDKDAAWFESTQQKNLCIRMRWATL